jgi:hypothetical protein
MPRKPRHTEPGTVYHLISRFVDRSWFFKDDDERSYYLQLLGRALADTDWCSLGYGLMSNHIHHAVVGGTGELHEWIRRVHAPFADWLNRKYGRIGTIFVRGPKQLAVNTDGVGQLLAYIHNNPVRAGVVSDAHQSSWTSHRAYLDLDRVPRWLRVEEGLALAGFADRTAFDDFVRLHPKDPTRDLLRDQRLVEDPEARESFHRLDEERRVDVEQVVEPTARILGMEPTMLRSRRRTRQHVFIRHVAACAADRVGVSGVRIAAALGMSQQGVSFILTKAPDKDVDETVNRVLAGLDELSRGMAAGNW